MAIAGFFFDTEDTSLDICVSISGADAAKLTLNPLDDDGCLTNANLTLDPQNTAASITVTVTATDEFMQSVEQTFKVTITE